MKRLHPLVAGTPRVSRRHHRSRPTPKWLTQSQELDAIAKSRCLMLLSVLSGETPVSDAIVEAKISRATYYQLEDKALQAMLAVLNPLASTTDPGAANRSAAGRVQELELQVQRLTQEKRRTERLLRLTRKTLKAPVKLAHRGRPSLIAHGPKCLPDSRAKVAATLASTPTPDGGSRP